MADIKVSGIYRYPIKSCKGKRLENAVVGSKGILYDREWVIIDHRGMFVAQRSDNKLGIGVKSLYMVKPEISQGFLVVKAPGMPILSIPLDKNVGDRLDVQIWRKWTVGIDQGQEAAKWVTEFISRERPGQYRLVRMPSNTIFPSKDGESQRRYSDAHSTLIISQESVDDLNARIAKSVEMERALTGDSQPFQPLDMRRFRPNFVLSGGDAYMEDGADFNHIQIGNVRLEGAGPCTRCVITTADPDTGERGKQPLKTLATYRKGIDGVEFGRNFNILTEAGIVAVGDSVKFL